MDMSHSNTNRWKMNNKCTTLDSLGKETTVTTSKCMMSRGNEAFRIYMADDRSRQRYVEREWIYLHPAVDGNLLKIKYICSTTTI